VGENNLVGVALRFLHPAILGIWDSCPQARADIGVEAKISAALAEGEKQVF